MQTIVKKKDLEKIDLEPQQLKFDDFVARCPEKLEFRDGYMGRTYANNNRKERFYF
ncbi:MAG: hypothetical protein V7K48_04060 [Nostoc sp.]|uniref:hypothetical protein n=1 Tax=Nostoc sp. TaxID=1180 RepID=UPI002FFBE847